MKLMPDMPMPPEEQTLLPQAQPRKAVSFSRAQRDGTATFDSAAAAAVTAVATATAAASEQQLIEAEPTQQLCSWDSSKRPSKLIRKTSSKKAFHVNNAEEEQIRTPTAEVVHHHHHHHHFHQAKCSIPFISATVSLPGNSTNDCLVSSEHDMLSATSPRRDLQQHSRPAEALCLDEPCQDDSEQHPFGLPQPLGRCGSRQVSFARTVSKAVCTVVTTTTTTSSATCATVCANETAAMTLHASTETVGRLDSQAFLKKSQSLKALAVDASPSMSSSKLRKAQSWCVRESQLQSEDGTQAQSRHKHWAQGSGSERWRHAVSEVRLSMRVLSHFRTLHSHSGLFNIKCDDLVPLEIIGEGAYAAVEKCLYLPQKRLVAVKRLKEKVIKEKPGSIRGLMKENMLLRKLHHKSIVEYIGCGHWEADSDESSLFVVEEYVDGGTLRSCVARAMRGSKQYTLQNGIRWLIQIAEGLQYLHERIPMVIHRDLKLENVLLQGKDPRTSCAKIADFGLSTLVSFEGPTPLNSVSHKSGSAETPDEVRALRRSSTSLARGWTDNARRRTAQPAAVRKAKVAPSAKAASVSSRADVLPVHTQDSRLSGRVGTLLYMAPEVFLKKQYSEKADVFSFSIVAYEILHHFLMISATDGSYQECEAYVRQVAKSGYRPPLDPRLPRRARDLIARCWDGQPHMRPSMADVVKALTEIQEFLDLQPPEEPAEVAGCQCGCCIS